MIKRRKIISLLAEKAGEELKVISCLGRISRDLFSFSSDENRYDCFYMVGAMGSTLPFSIGLAMARRDKKVIAVEGDGSILMNLGGLVTYHRYKPENLVLFIIDNRQYETTGGQNSQPAGFKLADVCDGIGLSTVVISEADVLAGILGSTDTLFSYDVVIIDTLPDDLSPRIRELPPALANNFKKRLC